MTALSGCYHQNGAGIFPETRIGHNYFADVRFSPDVTRLEPDIVWHGLEPRRADFGPTSRIVAFAIDGSQTGGEPDRDFYIACNARADPVLFRVPASPSGRPWRRVVDTALASPQDILPEEEGPRVAANRIYPLAPFALVVLITDA